MDYKFRMWFIEPSKEGQEITSRIRPYTEEISVYDNTLGIMQAEFQDPGFLTHLKRRFVLGQIRNFVSKTGERIGFVRINNHPGYPSGLVFSPLNEHDIHQSERLTINQRTDLSRIRLIGNTSSRESTPLTIKAFITFQTRGLVASPFDMEDSLILWGRRKEIEGNHLLYPIQ